jgi:hypothetical protein
VVTPGFSRLYTADDREACCEGNAVVELVGVRRIERDRAAAFRGSDGVRKARLGGSALFSQDRRVYHLWS